MMKYKKMKLSQIVPYENNPRNNEAAIDAVAESIKQCGYIAPIIVDEDMVILAGHTRRLALMDMGVDEVEVGIAEGLTEEQKKKYRLLDNKTNELAEWNFEKLAEELEGLDFEGFDFGFNFEIDEENNEEEKESSYTTNVNLPQYEPSENCPDLKELCDDAKTKNLINEINNTNIDNEIKEFLIMSAQRHLKFNYSKIADFYAHSDKDVQRLMEKSALVIIDVDDAIKNGYAELTKKI